MDQFVDKTRAADDMKGTVFATGFNQPKKPIMIGTVTIAGTILHMSVYPSRASRKGTLVNDIRLHYPPREKGRLKRVDS